MMESSVQGDLATRMEDLISRFAQAIKEDGSNNFRFHPGKVVDNEDPDKRGRVKVLVYQKYEGIPTEDLPWAIPQFSIMGNFNVPDVGRIVNVYFQDNDVHCPHYTTQVIQDDDLSDERLEDYPYTVVFFNSEDGEYLKMNKRTGETVYRHSSGTIVTFDKDGNFNLNTTHTKTGNVTMTIRGNLNAQVTGTATVNAPVITLPSGVVPPTGSGGFCAMPIDPLTGMPQVGPTLIRS